MDNNTQQAKELPTDVPSSCPFCREPIHVSAVKCPHCQEFRPFEGKKAKQDRTPLMNGILELFGKTLVPATILIIAFAFRPTVEALINRASEAQFMGTKLVFSQSAAFKGSLTPSELYYLIGSAESYGSEKKGGYNFDALERKGQTIFITSLQQKGLVEVKINENDKKNISIFGTRDMTLTPTEKGKQFLIELGLSFDGRHFVNSP